MLGRDIKRNTIIDGRTVRTATDGHRGLFRKGKPAGVEAVRLVTFTDGSKETFPADRPVVASGYVEPFPGGPTQSKLANNAERVRASDPRWRGETGGNRRHGLSTRETDLWAHSNAYDAARVNGYVGAAR